MYTKWGNTFFHFLGSSILLENVFPSTISRWAEFMHKIVMLKKKFSPMPKPGFTNVHKHTALLTGLAWAAEDRALETGGYYFSWERSRTLGWDWLIQTRWVTTHRCDKNRNTLQTFQALSSSPDQGGGSPVLFPYLPPNVLSNQRMLMMLTLPLHVSRPVTWHQT